MADPKHTDFEYQIHPPEGITLPPDRAERWSDLFRQAGLSPEQARDVQNWYWILNDDPTAQQVEREVLRPQEIETLQARQRALMQKRHSKGLSPGELTSLMER